MDSAKAPMYEYNRWDFGQTQLDASQTCIAMDVKAKTSEGQVIRGIGSKWGRWWCHTWNTEFYSGSPQIIKDSKREYPSRCKELEPSFVKCDGGNTCEKRLDVFCKTKECKLRDSAVNTRVKLLLAVWRSFPGENWRVRFQECHSLAVPTWWDGQNQ